MDLSKVIELYPTLLSLMEKEGYKKSTIEKYQWIINRMLTEASDPHIDSFESYYNYLEHMLSPISMKEVKTYLGTLKHFIVYGEFHRLKTFRSEFLSVTSYTKLNEYYKKLVDHSLSAYTSQGKLKDHTIKLIKSHSSVFSLHFQSIGFASFEDIKEQKPVLDYFFDGKHYLRNPAHRFYVKRFLEACCDISPACRFILGILPMVPVHKKNYDFLKPDERKKVESVLLGKGPPLTLRDKAVGILAFYTGLRSSDIANLKLDDIDLDKDEIIIPAQQKTGEPLSLVLRPVVRDAICEYVEKERPCSGCEHLFLTETVPIKRLTSGSMANIAKNILKAAQVRQDGGKGGLHLFRHAFASDLVSKDVSRYVVSSLLGHTSYASIDSYLDADIEHLRSCSLDISAFSSLSNMTARISPYISHASEYLMDLTSRLIGSGSYNADIHRMLISIDDFCNGTDNGRSLDQNVLDAWAKPFEGETNKAYCVRLKYANVINELINRDGLRIVRSEAPAKQKRRKIRMELSSRCDNLLRDFVLYRQASQHWNAMYDYHLRCFDQFGSDNYPLSTGLTQEMVDRWCEKKDTETLSSCGKRIAFIPSLCRYASVVTHGRLDLHAPVVSTISESTEMPHAFEDAELKNFFFACDNIPRLHKSKESLLRVMNVPAIFRLMFSSGLRTIEARELDREDVDFEQGIISIRRSKGMNEHRVALHPSALSYLQAFDDQMEEILPGRKAFFPNVTGGYNSSTWLDLNFMQAWYLYNRETAIPYDLRHNYAVTNINSWPADREAFNKNLVYLSRSMGHANVDSTMYYYHYTPAMARHIMSAKGSTFDNIVNGTFLNEQL